RHTTAPSGGTAAVIDLDAARAAHDANQPTPVTRLTDELPGAVASQLEDMPGAPDKPTTLADLIAARNAVNSAETNDPAVNPAIPVPADITAPVLELLADRGDTGARRDEIVTVLRRSENSVKRWLRIMRDHGLIANAGSTSAARYYLPEHSPDPGEPEQD